MIHNPIKEILAVGTIATIATYLFIDYVKYYERKYGSKKPRRKGEYYE